MKESRNDYDALSRDLRAIAETKLRERRANGEEEEEEEEEDLKSLVEELSIHQLELEVQNEELRKIQHDLRAAHDRYAVLYDKAPVAFLTLSTKGQVLNCNRAASTLFGRPRTHIIDHFLHEFVAAECQDALHLHCYALINHSQTQATALNLKTSGDVPRTVLLESELDSQLIPGELSWFASLTDISDQKKLEAELSSLNRELEERVQERARQYLASRQETLAVLNAAADPIITIDSEGLIQSLNRATCRVFGYAEDELLGINLRTLLTNAGVDVFRRALEDCAEEEVGKAPKVRREALWRMKNGTKVPVEMALARIDEAKHFTIVLRDLRDKKRLELEVMQVTESERSRISRELHDSLGQELAAMSIDTRLIAEDKAGIDEATASKFRRFSEQLQRCIVQLRTIIFDLAPIDVSDGDLVDALEALVRSIPEQDDLKCSFHLSHSESLMALPRETEIQLLRIAQEGVHNARKHSGAKQIVVALSGKGGGVELQIIDDGRGVPRKKRSSFAGQGFRIMEYRCSLIGGELEIMNYRPNGTKVVCRIEQAPASEE
ncbi:PAS domain-containing sensor histidine kinase [Marinobacter panjinensis]|nr:PAS domain S-box protein [Marinobacter panjinensis]MCR8915657.1 PAS domain S-box protein [Marinobacter panjinensis]